MSEIVRWIQPFAILLTWAVTGIAATHAATEPVSFDVSTGRPMVEMRVNGQGPYPIVLDTGAPGLILRPALVEELGLEIIGTTEVNSPVGGTPVEAQQVRVDSIDLAGASVTHLEAIVIGQLGGGQLGMGVVGPAASSAPTRARAPSRSVFSPATASSPLTVFR